jgi:cell division protein FtsW (lipid II flippase)
MATTDKPIAFLLMKQPDFGSSVVLLLLAGIAMVILGSSLLAYYTWDKHWLVRYTIMPALLALFTWSLAGAGRSVRPTPDRAGSCHQN